MANWSSNRAVGTSRAVVAPTSGPVEMAAWAITTTFTYRMWTRRRRLSERSGVESTKPSNTPRLESGTRCGLRQM